MSSDADQTGVLALADALPILAFVSDGGGSYTFTNRPFQSFSDRGPDDLLGEGWVGVLHPDDQARARVTWQNAVTGGTAYEAEYRFRRFDGVYRWHLCRGNAVRDAGGSIVAWVGTCTDVEERQRVDANLQGLLTTLPVGVLIAHDRECDLITGNPAAAELLRLPPGSNFSMTAREGERPEHFRILQNGREVRPAGSPIRRAARGETVRDEELDIQFADGSTLHTLVSARPLYDAVGELRGSVGSLMDVSALQRANRAIQAADRRKDEFLAILAHELRNPMASVQTGLDLLRHADLSAGVRDARDMMQRELRQLTHVVDALLDVSRLKRGELQLQSERLEIDGIVDAALEYTRPVLAGHRLALGRSGAGSLEVDGDRICLTQVFSNLLSNAAQYSDSGTTIGLSIEASDAEVVVRVRDAGIGIAPERMQEIFEMFTSSGEPRVGLGIGLAFARELVSLHGGRIDAASGGVGHGSEFAVRLPRHNPSARQPAGNLQEEAAQVLHPVLIVDDHADSADALGTLLSLDGHTVRVAHDGPSALQVLGEFHPRIVLLDLGMPQMNGFDVARHIRRMPGGQQIHLVAVSGWGQERDRDRARKAGIDEHVTKPVELNELRRLIGRVAGE